MASIGSLVTTVSALGSMGFGIGFIVRHEGLVGQVIDGLRSSSTRPKLPTSGLRQSAQLLFANGKRHYRDIGCFQPLVSQFL